MKHIYSNNLIAYLFDEIDLEAKNKIEKELKSNQLLRAELADLKMSLDFLKDEKPMSPNPRLIKNILEDTFQTNPIQVD